MFAHSFQSLSERAQATKPCSRRTSGDECAEMITFSGCGSWESVKYRAGGECGRRVLASPVSSQVVACW